MATHLNIKGVLTNIWAISMAMDKRFDWWKSFTNLHFGDSKASGWEICIKSSSLLGLNQPGVDGCTDGLAVICNFSSRLNESNNVNVLTLATEREGVRNVGQWDGVRMTGLHYITHITITEHEARAHCLHAFPIILWCHHKTTGALDAPALPYGLASAGTAILGVTWLWSGTIEGYVII